MIAHDDYNDAISFCLAMLNRDFEGGTYILTSGNKTGMVMALTDMVLATASRGTGGHPEKYFNELRDHLDQQAGKDS